MESIRSTKGFYGWKCQSYFHYILGLCSFKANDMLLAGANCEVTSRGMYLVKTNSDSPFAIGRANNDLTSRRWRNDALKFQLKALKMVKEQIENGNFREGFDDNEDDGYASVLEKLEGSNYRSPKVLSINDT
jgi:pancreatic lipase-related protein 2